MEMRLPITKTALNMMAVRQPPPEQRIIPRLLPPEPVIPPGVLQRINPPLAAAVILPAAAVHREAVLPEATRAAVLPGINLMAVLIIADLPRTAADPITVAHPPAAHPPVVPEVPLLAAVTNRHQEEVRLNLPADVRPEIHREEIPVLLRKAPVSPPQAPAAMETQPKLKWNKFKKELLLSMQQLLFLPI